MRSRGVQILQILLHGHGWEAPNTCLAWGRWWWLGATNSSSLDSSFLSSSFFFLGVLLQDEREREMEGWQEREGKVEVTQRGGDLTRWDLTRVMGCGSSKNQENSDIISEWERRIQMNFPYAGKTLKMGTGCRSNCRGKYCDKRDRFTDSTSTGRMRSSMGLARPTGLT